MLLRRIYYLLTPTIRRAVRRIWFLPLDVYESISGKRESLVPPRGLIFTGAGDFKLIGQTLLNAIILHCKITPKDKVLDIGCGIGRMARPLTSYLNDEGSYFGFDIVELGINWCKVEYKNFPNFSFEYIPMKNDLYNLSTDNKPSESTFPYNSNFFDLVILISVFTHMQEDDVKRYITEISRVLKSGKYCFCTFFLITKATDEYLARSARPLFKYKHANYFLHDAKVKDANIAYKYEVIEEMIISAGMRIKTYIPGWWAGDSESSVDFQDVLIIQKEF